MARTRVSALVRLGLARAAPLAATTGCQTRRGDLFQRELALTHLGELYYWVDDREQSREFYQRTLNSTRSSPELVAEAAYRVGEMASQDGDIDQAVRYLAQARDTGDADFGPQAGQLLSQLTG